MTILLADAGGTYIRSAWVDSESSIRGEQSQSANTFESLSAALSHRIQGDQIQPDCVIVAVAGPVMGDRVEFTNRPWNFSQRQLKSELGLKRLIVINDFAAVALALPILKPSQHDVIRPVLV